MIINLSCIGLHGSQLNHQIILLLKHPLTHYWSSQGFNLYQVVTKTLTLILTLTLTPNPNPKP